MEKTFQTGSFSFRLKFPEELVLPVDMEKFLVENGFCGLYIYHYGRRHTCRKRRES